MEYAELAQNRTPTRPAGDGTLQRTATTSAATVRLRTRRLASDCLVPIVYGELRGIARRHLRRPLGGQTLSTTVLVHETYIKLGYGQAKSRGPLRGYEH